MRKYSRENDIDAVILAGDNVYDTNPTDDEVEKYKSGEYDEVVFKNITYDIRKQISEGFQCCMKTVETKTFLIAVGNHDIETCDVLNYEINYKGWHFPALSYNYKYILRSGKNINLIFIDTNIYSTEYCTGVYPDDAKMRQHRWIDSVLDKDSWNIIVGHDPFVANSHKGKKARITEDLYEYIKINAQMIDLYLCADEHNQQYIVMDDMPAEIISGSGGAILDTEITYEDLKDKTMLGRATFGFVGLKIFDDWIGVEYYATDGSDTENFRINKKRA
jgi:hypothetical protein